MATFTGKLKEKNILVNQAEQMLNMMEKQASLSGLVGPKGNAGASVYEQNPYSTTTVGAATSNSSYEYTPHTMKRTSNTLIQRDAHAIDNIMQMREEIEELVDGKHTLSPYFGKGTVREMIKELRTDIRIIKYENELTELDIIKHLVLEKEKGTRYETETTMPGTGFPGGSSFEGRIRGLEASNLTYDEAVCDTESDAFVPF